MHFYIKRLLFQNYHGRITVQVVVLFENELELFGSIFVGMRIAAICESRGYISKLPRFSIKESTVWTLTGGLHHERNQLSLEGLLTFHSSSFFKNFL